MVVSHDDLIVELQHQREAIIAELFEMAQQPYYRVGYGNHQADDGSAAFDQAAGLAIRQNAKHLLLLIDDAMERWESGTYGYCQRCGTPIDPARLKAIPYAQMCMPCAEHFDFVH